MSKKAKKVVKTSIAEPVEAEEEKLVEEEEPQPTEEKVDETKEVAEEEPVEVATEEPTAEEEATQTQPQEEVVEPEVVVEEPELTEAERLTRLYKQLLDIYEAAPPGHISLGYVLEETGASKIEIDQTWDKLYDQRKVPYSRLYKPEG